MPGPKMGPRPDDFNEELIRQAPAYKKWEALTPGGSMKYACRNFVKGCGDDEERLMRRIMIARRNNVKDHNVIKQMRAAEADSRGVDVEEMKKRKKTKRDNNNNNQEEEQGGENQIGEKLPPIPPSNPSGTKPRRLVGTLLLTDQETLDEMDVPAIEATPTYKKWMSLSDGGTFTYNQTYVKGRMDQDWLLRKNIWRRMRYRRENKQKVEAMLRKKSYEAAAAAAAAVAVADSLDAPPDNIDVAALAALDAGDELALNNAAAQLDATIQDEEAK
jgi:hypothetical protein